MRKYFFLIFWLSSISAFSQHITISGIVLDTSAKSPLPYSVAMAITLNDSTLVQFTRSDSKGFFALRNLPIDTYQVIISHPKFSEQTFIIIGTEKNTEFDFGKIVLPYKIQTLKEIVIFAYKDPVYYKGDTLIFTADSFTVKPNAMVEDLLKKLPGVKVDAQGKITVQGTEVSQVLVDGDEFFGSDPTVATKNLPANSVESINVYEKKHENAADAGDATIKVMDLHLKEEAKKGYFGKASGASDFQKFYEGNTLFNRFSNKRKISFFGLASNTPNSSFDWSDVSKFGLSDEYYNYSETSKEGIPSLFKTGIYYTDKISPKTKVSVNYTYNPNRLEIVNENRTQYFLSDSSYSTENKSVSEQKNEMNKVNMRIEQKLDSLIELEFTPRFQTGTNSNTRTDINDFLTRSDTLSHRTNTSNTNTSKNNQFSSSLELTKKFLKKERVFVLYYNFGYTGNESEGILKSSDTFYTNSFLSKNNIDQKKINFSDNISHNGSVTYTEPLTKKIKLEFVYEYSYNQSLQNKKAFNFFNGEYSLTDSLLTSNFENSRSINRIGTKFIYEVRKQRLAMGTRIRQVILNSNNTSANQNFSETINNILPYMNYQYKFSDNQRINFYYYTNSTPPNINQLQPVQDNTNPNQIRIGNPDLSPDFEHGVNIYFNSFKPVSERNIWANCNFTFLTDDFSNSTTYDSIGRTITQTVNVKGNFKGSGSISLDFPVFKKILKLNPHISTNYSNNNNYINSIKNTTQELSIYGNLNILLEIGNVNFSIGGNYDYNTSSASLNNKTNTPYSSQGYNASFEWEFPKKLIFETRANYIMNMQRTMGYNINYLIWNASLSKTFLKKENLILAIDANDILNQKISTRRNVQENIISDTKTNTIGRYILLRITYKFNSSKAQEDETEF